MADGTKIEWTDATANAINGCMVLSPGCKNCYAMKQAHRFPVRQGLTRQSGGGMVWTGDVRLSEKVLEQVLGWQRPRRIFWNAHGDTFYDKVPREWVDNMWAVLALTPQHTHQVLTKRTKRAADYLDDLTSAQGAGRVADIIALRDKTRAEWFLAEQAERSCLPNVWLGTSVEDQTRADERIPILLATPAAVRWISAEPLLGPVDLTNIDTMVFSGCELLDALRGEGKDFLGEKMRQFKQKIDWVVAGGESGPGARPMHPDWARSLRDQCEAAGVPMLFKQWGNWTPNDVDATDSSEGIWLSPDGTMLREVADVHTSKCAKPCRLMWRTTKTRAGRLLDGREWNGYPEGEDNGASGACAVE